MAVSGKVKVRDIAVYKGQQLRTIRKDTVAFSENYRADICNIHTKISSLAIEINHDQILLTSCLNNLLSLFG